MKSILKNLFLMSLVTLLIPFAVNAEETETSTKINTEATTTTDDTAVVKLYERDKEGKEIKLSNPIKSSNIYTYSATVDDGGKNFYYFDIVPNYEYENIEYSVSGSGFELSSSEKEALFKDSIWSNLDGVLIATVTKKDATTVQYKISLIRSSSTIYVEEETKEPAVKEESKEEEKVTEKQDTTNKTETKTENKTETKEPATKEESKEENTVKNPNTGIYIGAGSLSLILISMLLMKKKNKFNKV